MRSKPVILVALLLAAFLVNLDTMLVNVALPAMVRQLHATTTQLQWVVDAYNLVFAALLLTFGSVYASVYTSRLAATMPAAVPGSVAAIAHQSVGAAYVAAGKIAALGHPALGLALHHASTNAFLRGLIIGALVAGGVAAVGAVLAVQFLPAQPAQPATPTADEAGTARQKQEAAERNQ